MEKYPVIFGRACYTGEISNFSSPELDYADYKASFVYRWSYWQGK